MAGEPQSTFTAPLLQTHTHWQEYKHTLARTQYTHTGKNIHTHWQEHTIQTLARTFVTDAHTGKNTTYTLARTFITDTHTGKNTHEYYSYELSPSQCIQIKAFLNFL